MNIENLLYEVYLQGEMPFKEDTQEKLIVSGFYNKKYWVRFTYFKKTKVLVATDLTTEERLIYQY